MKLAMLILVGSVMSVSAMAQVGPSVSTPTQPTGKTPPGAPTTEAAQARNAPGNAVIGHATTPNAAVPGDVGKKETGSK